ncbi:MAG: SEC-C domain-containing protein [Bdellovibrionales bacterium]|nr:SEC-C domain-containing protein [Bdellovibrionales bacterium]
MEAQDYKNIGRNDPCPCGSGKKFKKCHADSAEAAAWHGNEKPQTETSAEGGEAAPQFDPSKMDLNWLAEFSSAIQRLPKGQMQQLQALMQKAMAGKDVARELDEFQRKLPTNVQELLTKSPELNQQFENAQAQAGKGTPTSELTEEQRAKLIEIQKNNEKSGLSRLWNKFRGK